jgi:hypothetical protein
MKSKPELWAFLSGFAWIHAAIARLYQEGREKELIAFICIIWRFFLLFFRDAGIFVLGLYIIKNIIITRLTCMKSRIVVENHQHETMRVVGR